MVIYQLRHNVQISDYGMTVNVDVVTSYKSKIKKLVFYTEIV
jgi:uncharacterized protein YeaC (DUF1315 family)